MRKGALQDLETERHPWKVEQTGSHVLSHGNHNRDRRNEVQTNAVGSPRKGRLHLVGGHKEDLTREGDSSWDLTSADKGLAEGPSGQRTM